MEFVSGGSVTENEFFIFWATSGFFCWLFFVLFVGYTLGYQEFKKPMMKMAGLLTLGVMVPMGLLGLTITLTAFVPFIERVLGPEINTQKGD